MIVFNHGDVCVSYLPSYAGVPASENMARRQFVNGAEDSSFDGQLMSF